jgi:hypothetical protein
MSDFKPLDAQRAIRDDTSLRASDKALLWSAVLRTDNSTRKVRASLSLLAKDAGVHPNTATSVFSKANEPVMRYFEEVDRQTRRINLRFHPSDVLLTRVHDSHSECESRAVEEPTLTVSVSHSECESQVEESPTLTTTVRVDDPFALAEARLSQSEGSTLTVSVSDSHSECEPSASLCSTSAITFHRPSELAGDEEALDTETPSGPLPEEPASDEGLAAASDSVEMCDLHTSFPAGECDYCDKPKRVDRRPEWKQEQQFTDRQRQDEAPGLDGYPIEGAEVARLSDVRKRRRSA